MLYINRIIKIVLKSLKKYPVVIEMINTPMPKPILTGKDLIDYGLKPNPLFSKMLRVALIHQFEQNETDKKRLFYFVKNIKE